MLSDLRKAALYVYAHAPHPPPVTPVKADAYITDFLSGPPRVVGGKPVTAKRQEAARYEFNECQD